MKKEMRLISLLFVIFFINFASAGFNVGNPSNSIGTVYMPGDPITGWVNISFSSEPTTSFLKSSFGGSINLLDLLGKDSNSGFVKTCNPLGCASNYVANSPETSKVLNLAEGGSVLVGFNIQGSATHLLSDISAFTFNLTSNNPETEKFPLAIDILNDGKYEWNAYKASDLFTSENKGCFYIATGQANIANIAYCERIRLQKTPEVEIGAYIQGNTPGIDFLMKINSVDGLKHGSCTTDAANGDGTVEKVSCLVPSFSVQEANDYFVCIMTSSALDINKYKINIEQDEAKCGYSSSNGQYEGSYSYDFEIFARPKKYLGGINFSLNDNELANAKSYLNNIELYLEEYISDTYGNNCSKGCVIPVKIDSGVAQQITLSNTYVTDSYIINYISGLSLSTNDFYNVAETPALITSGFQKLDLGEVGFRVPLEIGSKTLSITLNSSSGEQQLLSKQINVSYAEAPKIKDLSPQRAGVKVPTLFTVLLNGTMNVTRYMWNFGDGKSENTTKGEVSHTYGTVGTYIIEVSLIRNQTVLSTRKFNITVMTASETVSALLSESDTKIASIKAEMKNLSAFEQKAINYSLKLGQTEKTLATLKTSAANAGSDEAKYEPILTQLLNLKIPVTIAKTAYSDGITFYPSGTVIDLEVLKAIGGGEYEAEKEDLYKQAVISWDAGNLEQTALVYSEISALYLNYQEPFVRVFDFRIEKSTDKNAYIIIKKMENLLFKEDYSEEEEGGYYYINFDEPEKRITFSTTEDVDFLSLPVFISPAISELDISEILPPPEPNPKRWITFGIIIALLAGIFVASWLVLQVWYRRKYEAHLFKNRNNLLNLVNYIQNEKIKGVKEGDIAAKLKRTGWSSEQIRYALRKHAGKRTGMPEISLRKFKKEKVQKQIR